MHAFDVLGDPVRRRILELLAGGEHTSGAVIDVIRAEFGLSQPGVSKHLRVLRENGFATVRRGRHTADLRPRGPTAPGGRRLARSLAELLGATPRRAGHGDRQRQALRVRPADGRRRRPAVEPRGGYRRSHAPRGLDEGWHRRRRRRARAAGAGVGPAAGGGVRDLWQRPPLPARPGPEAARHVARPRAGGDRRRRAAGLADVRYAVSPNVTCGGTCAFCRSGRTHLCGRGGPGIGLGRHGGLADLVDAPLINLAPIPDGVDPVTARSPSPWPSPCTEWAGRRRPPTGCWCSAPAPSGCAPRCRADRAAEVAITARHPHQRAAAEAWGHGHRRTRRHRLGQGAPSRGRDRERGRRRRHPQRCHPRRGARWAHRAARLFSEPKAV